MQTLLYANGGNTASQNCFNPSLAPENRLNLLPEHRSQINEAFMDQLLLAPFSGRQMRLAMTVFKQTIGYNKREDDMNGTRLEQLSGVRGDHANAVIRELEGLNVLITRQGYYGKWMSINFDFEHWGKPCPESQTNDPFYLLPDIYQPYIAEEEEELEEFKLHIPPQSLNKKPAVATPIVVQEVVKTEAPKTQAIPTISTVSIPPELATTQEIPAILTLSTTEEIPTILTTSIAPEASKSQETPATPTVSETQETPATPAISIAPEASKTQEIPAIPTVAKTQETATTPTIPAIAEPETRVNTAKEESIETLEINQAVPLNYPESIPEKLRKLLEKHLKGFKIQQQAQRLLNYFAKCLKERDIRNPIAYFIALKNRLFNGQLDLEESEYQSDIDTTKKAQAEKLQSQLAYQAAALDLQQLKKTIEFIRESKNCTFEEALHEMNYVSIWDKAVKCFVAAREALKTDPLAPLQSSA